MPPSWWNNVPATVRAMIAHTINCAVAVASFKILFWFTHKGVGPGWTLTILDQTENIVITVVYVFFAAVLLYDLTKERVHAVIQFFRSQTLVA
jgi:sterol desaturase/sphingolipid hydroxylase (fatty acid hydroxylase superfamily)